MKTRTIYFLPVLAIFLVFFNTGTAENIILNPGFEASGVNLKNWSIAGPVPAMQPVTGIDSQVSYEGRYSLKMESTNPNCHGRVIQTVEIVGGQTYLFSTRFKTKNVNSVDKSVLIKVKWFKGKENIGYNYIYEIADKSKDWLLATNKIKAIEGATTAEISLEFRWGTGTIWWDDISLEACPEEPARNVKVGSVYCRPQGPTVEDNIKEMSKLLDEAGTSGCQIVCLPEGWPTCNTGLGTSKVEANTLDGSASVMMAQKAKQYKMYIVSCLYSWVGDTLNNIAVLYNRQGEIQGIYKKVQLPDSEAEAGIVPGNSFPVFTTDFGKIGILICYDIFYPEVSRILALNGAEILFCPIWGDIRGPGGDIAKVIVRSRAIDNGVYFINSIYDGHSMIVNPAGDILQETGKQGTLITENIDLNFNPPWDWVGNAGRGVWKGIWRKDRRSDLYDNLKK